jgi:hypothetical protein
MSNRLPEPFSVRPSGEFEGNDGSWSTFLLTVGNNPAQSFRALISTSSFSTWLPTPAGCIYESEPTFVPNNCPELRGVGLANGFQSQGFDDANGTFRYIGIHTLEIGNDLSITEAFGSQYNATANLGLDTLIVQNGAGSEELLSGGNVPIFGLSTWNFFLPSLGIGVGYLQSTTQESPSLVENLANESVIPSRSWSYTAGASYRDYVGSLVLGGYDDTRLNANTTTHYALQPSTQTTELQVNLASIAFSFANGTEASIPVSETVVIDSTLPYLYLPAAVCDDLASRLGLTYNEPADLFTISPEALAANREAIEQIRITVGDTQNSGNTTSITFPYTAFELNATWPTFDQGQSQPFYPIRRASGDTFILGRAFLQEAHLSVDWERAYFNISQTAFPSTRTEPNLIPIYNNSVTNGEVSAASSSGSSSSSGGLGGGAIAGIVIGVIAALLILLALLWFCIFRKRSQRSHELEAHEKDDDMMQSKVSSIIPTLSPVATSPTGTFDTTHDPISPIDGSFLHVRRVNELGTESAADHRAGVNALPGIHEVADSQVKLQPALLSDEVSPRQGSDSTANQSTPRSELDGSSDVKPAGSARDALHSSPSAKQDSSPRSELEA